MPKIVLQNWAVNGWRSGRSRDMMHDGTGWTRVPYSQIHEIHPDGRVRNAVTGKELKPRLTKGGYHRVSFSLHGRDFYIHSLVLEVFRCPRPTAAHQASHIDGNKANNCLANLAWETPAENNARKLVHGTATFGLRNPMGAKTHCKRGHPFNEVNTRRANGKRICRICARDHMRAKRAPLPRAGQPAKMPPKGDPMLEKQLGTMPARDVAALYKCEPQSVYARYNSAELEALRRKFGKRK